MQISVEFQVDDLLITARNMQKVLGGKNAILRSVGETLLNANRARHARQTGPDGTPWKPLAQSTVSARVARKRGAKAKEQARRSGRILFNSGDMMRDFTYQVSGDTVFIGFRQTIAAYHHFGTGIHGPKGSAYTIEPKAKRALAFAGLVRKKVTHPGIPARPLVGLPEGDISLVKEVVAEHIMSAVAGKRGR